MNVLLIDDDINLARLLKQYLDGYQWQLQHAALPSDAYRKISEHPPDAIILDVMLPEEDGFQVCRRLREKWDIPIIMLTARGDVTDRVVGLELGADDYLPKPFEPRELVARIQTIVRRLGRRNTLTDFGARPARKEIKAGLLVGGKWVGKPYNSANADRRFVRSEALFGN